VTKPLSITQIIQWVDDAQDYAATRRWLLPERKNHLDYILGWEGPVCDYVGRVLNVLKIYSMKSSQAQIVSEKMDAAPTSAQAGEQRDLVRYIAEHLIQAGFRVFYDEFEKADLWGKNLYDHLFEIYNSRALYCMIFISEAYSRKVWTNHERTAAQAAAFAVNREYILPVRVDDTKIPGLPDTIGYIDARHVSLDEIVRLAQEKLSKLA
jgi:TIR domain